MIRGWVALWDDTESPRVLALVRMLVATVLLYDFLYQAWLGIVPTLWAPRKAGGLGDVLGRVPPPALYTWLGADAAWVAWSLVVVSCVTFGIGLFPRLSGLVLLLTYAELAWALPLGDRGIDMMMRNCVLLLTLSGCGRAFSIDAAWRGEAATVPSWPRHLLILQLVVMYFTAGIQKTALSWTPFGGFSALYIILQDPSIAAWRFDWLARVYPLTQLATATTIVFELGAGLLPFAYWYRRTRTRPGRLRAWMNRLPYLRVWMFLGVALHLGIAATMTLGIFPWAMLALYPAFFHPDELRGVHGRANRADAPRLLGRRRPLLER